MAGAPLSQTPVLYLVRHADAGSRSGWRGDDQLRPLDDRGRAQAEALAAALAPRPVKRILSSPAARCTGTVEPLARELGLEVRTAEELCEGSHPADALRLMGALATEDGDSVLCSHGDVIPGVLWMLGRGGVDLPDLGRCKKASIWELAVEDGQVLAGTYRHPRTFGAA